MTTARPLLPSSAPLRTGADPTPCPRCRGTVVDVLTCVRSEVTLERVCRGCKRREVLGMWREEGGQ